MPSPADSDDNRCALLAVPDAPIEAPCRAGYPPKLDAHTGSRMPQLRQDLAAVVVRVAEGDRAELLSGASSVKLYGIVQRILGRLLGRQDWADAVLEDVYGRVWQRAGDCDGASGSSDTWPEARLATLARNLALDHIRRPSASPENLPSSLRETPIA